MKIVSYHSEEFEGTAEEFATFFGYVVKCCNGGTEPATETESATPTSAGTETESATAMVSAEELAKAAEVEAERGSIIADDVASKEAADGWQG